MTRQRREAYVRRLQRRTHANPVTSAGYHLRPGQRVLWESDDGHYMLAVIDRVDSTSKSLRVPSPEALIHFPNGAQIFTPLNRIHALPNHGPYRRSHRRHHMN